MPFTLSHPAAAVPFARFGLSLSALVVGSMSPDFPYFFLLGQPFAQYGHTLPGLFLFCLPASLVVLWLFHAVLKRPLLSLLPLAHQERLMPYMKPYPFLPLRRFGVVVASILVGAVTHLVWDSFTHDYGFFVERFPILREPFLSLGAWQFTGFRVFQHASSVFGLLFLAFLYWRWYKNAPRQPLSAPDPKPRLLVWVLLPLVALVVGFGYSYLSLAPIETAVRWRTVLVRGVVAVMAVGMLELFVFALVWHLLRRRTVA